MKHIILIMLFLFKTGAAFCAGQVYNATFNKIKPVADKKVNVAVYFTGYFKKDTVDLFYQENSVVSFSDEKDKNCIHVKSVLQKDGKYRFSFIPKSKFGYFTIFGRDTTVGPQKFFLLSIPFEVQYGDNIVIGISQKKPDLKYYFYNLAYHFSGPSQKKYELQLTLDSINNWVADTANHKSNLQFPNTQKALSVLEKNKTIIDHDLYNRLKADIFFSDRLLGKYRNIKGHYQFQQKPLYEDEKQMSNYRRVFDSVANLDAHVQLPNDVLFHNLGYTQFLLVSAQVKELIHFDKIDQTRLYNYLKTSYSGVIRDKLFVTYLSSLNGGTTIADYNNIVKDVIANMSSNIYPHKIEQYKNRMSGNTAYDFSLPDKNGNIVKLSDFKGKVVFIDFWFTGCGNCQIFYTKHLSTAEEYFKNNPNVVFITISVDKVKDHWQKSINEGAYTSPDVVNLYTAGLGIRHPVIKYYDIFDYPHPLIIDRNGKIVKYSDVNLRNKTKLIKAINEQLL